MSKFTDIFGVDNSVYYLQYQDQYSTQALQNLEVYGWLSSQYYV